MQQLLLPLSFKSSNPYSFHEFLIHAENRESYSLVENFFIQKDFLSSLIPSLILKGERACGKTHLLKIFAQKYSAEFIDKNFLEKANSHFFAPNKYYIFDEALKQSSEEEILHIINLANESLSFLILAIEDNFTAKLIDLNSRIKNIVTTQIKDLQIPTIKELITFLLSKKQIFLPQNLTDFITQEIRPSYAAINDFVHAMNFIIGEGIKIDKNSLSKIIPSKSSTSVFK